MVFPFNHVPTAALHGILNRNEPSDFKSNMNSCLRREKEALQATMICMVGWHSSHPLVSTGQSNSNPDHAIYCEFERALREANHGFGLETGYAYVFKNDDIQQIGTASNATELEV